MGTGYVTTYYLCILGYLCRVCFTLRSACEALMCIYYVVLYDMYVSGYFSSIC